MNTDETNGLGDNAPNYGPNLLGHAFYPYSYKPKRFTGVSARRGWNTASSTPRNKPFGCVSRRTLRQLSSAYQPSN